MTIYGEDLTGVEVQYMGKPYTVEKDDGFDLDLKGKDGSKLTIKKPHPYTALNRTIKE